MHKKQEKKRYFFTTFTKFKDRTNELTTTTYRLFWNEKYHCLFLVCA